MSFSIRNRGASDEGDAGAPGPDRRRVLLLGGLGAGTVAAVGVAAVVLTSSGGGADVAVGVPPKLPAATAAPTATASPTTSDDSPVSGADARDPFAPLVVAEAAGTGAASAAGGSDPTAAPVATGSTAPTPSSRTTTHTTAADLPWTPPSTPPSRPSSQPTSTPSSSSPSGSPAKTWFRSSAGADPTKASVRVTLDVVAAANGWATLRVDGKKYSQVKPGDQFAERFRLLELRDDRCGTLEYGNGYRFDICEGHTRALS